MREDNFNIKQYKEIWMYETKEWERSCIFSQGWVKADLTYHPKWHNLKTRQNTWNNRFKDIREKQGEREENKDIRNHAIRHFLKKKKRNQAEDSAESKAFVLSHFRLLETPWTVAHQAPLSMGFSRQEYGVGCCAVLQGMSLTQGSNPRLKSPALAGVFFTTSAIWEAC